MKEVSELLEDIAAEMKKSYLRQDAKIANFEGQAARIDDLELKLGRRGLPSMGPNLEGSIGAKFVQSEQYKSMISRKVFDSDPFELKDIVASRLIDTGAGLSVLPDVIPGMIAPAERILRIRNLIPTSGTTSNSIAFVRETLFTNAAAPVKESKEGSEATKPESAKEFEPGVEQVQTIAHWIPVTRQILADAPVLQGFISNQLIYGLKLAEEDQILFGNGVAPQLNGITGQATVYDNTLPTQLGVTNITRIDDIRAAILQAMQAEYPVSGLVLNPFDWAAMELLKTTQRNYLWVSVNDGGVARLWRLPVVETNSMPQGYFLVGAFSLGAQIFNREQSTIRVSEHHESFFVQNLVAILAEERLALVVTRPQAFIYGSFAGGS
jgi:HK97 family phage major capsid protein